MSTAGKDAQAGRRESHGPKAPSGALARVAPRGYRLSQDHALFGRSVWCGVVFALAVTIVSINALPPTDVGYRVTAQALLSPQRFAMLKKHGTQDASQSAPARLVAAKLLDEGTALHALRTPPDSDPQILIEVSCLWNHRTSSRQVHQWLNEITKVDEGQLKSFDSIRAQRFARWEVQAQQHYLNHLRQSMAGHRKPGDSSPTDRVAANAAAVQSALQSGNAGSKAKEPGDPSSKRDASSLDTPVFVVPDVASAERGPMHLASHGSNQVSIGTASLSHAARSTTIASPETLSTETLPVETLPIETLSTATLLTATSQAVVSDADVELEKKLVKELEQARRRQQQVRLAGEQAADQASGTLQLSGAPRVHAQPQPMPRPQIVSLLVLAVAAGAVGGWANHRAQSGGTYDAREVAANMQLLGLPVVVRLCLPTNEIMNAESRVSRRLTNYRRWAVQQCLALSELVVLCWCVAIVIRIVLDPLWRTLLWESPLAALARLFVGLP